MRPLSSIGLNFFNWSLLGIAASILIFQLVVPPVVGVGDNGDWYRLMIPAGFRHLPNHPKDAGFFVNKVEFSSPAGSYGYLVSGVSVALVARAIGPLLSRDGLFDLRIIGLLHAALLIFGLGLILRATQTLEKVPRRIGGVLLIFVFTDVGYVAFLNSFYTQTASMLFLLTAAGCFLMLISSREREGLWFSALSISALLYVTSKPQEAPQSILIGILLVFSALLASFPRPRLTGALAAVGIVVVAFGCALPSGKALHDQCLYNQVFDDILRYSPDVASDLESLELSQDLMRYQSHNAFEPDSPVRSPEFRSAFFANVGYHDVLRFYAEHPARFFDLLKRRADLAFGLVTAYGNYDRSVGKPEWTTSRSFSYWSTFKRKALPGSIWMLIAIFAVHFTGVALFWMKGPSDYRFRVGVIAFAMLNLMAIGAFVMCAVLDGILDVIRQLFAFNVMIDLMLLTDVVVLCYAVSLIWQRRNQVA